MSITYDNSKTYTSSGNSTTTFDMGSGSNGYLIARTTKLVTALTYNGVSMSLLVDFVSPISDGNQQSVRIWGLANPSTGTNTVAPTITGGNGTICLSSYLGVRPTGQPENYSTAYSNNGVNNTQVTTLATSVSTLTDNSWTIMGTTGGNNFPNTFTASQGTLRVTEDSIAGDGGASIIDSGASISPAGTSTLEATWSAGSGFMSNVIISLKPISVPAAPTIGTAIGGIGSATVSFTPGDDGGSTVTSYTVTSTPGGLTASGGSSPITVTGLNAGVSYTFTVYATNAIGNSAESASTAAITLQSGMLLFL